MDGVLLINKEKGLTSHDVVQKARKFLNTKKVGHCGTLDPLAEGLLVLTIGKALKISRFIENDYKEYIASISLGIKTSTMDEEGTIVEQKQIAKFNKQDILSVFNSLIGKIMQKPPIYSAIKINGKKLYEYARNNETIDISEREVEIKELELLDYDAKKIKYRVVCSKGTYIRVLCETIAYKLNNIGYMEKLVRTKVGKLDVENAYFLKDIESSNYKLISISDALTGFTFLVLEGKDLFKAINGNVLDFYVEGNVAITNSNNDIIALYKGEVTNNSLTCIRVLK